jgi:hypothetical protein
MPANLPLDRLVRKEVALGVVREIEPPTQHIGLQIAPFLPVESDDVIFDYAKGLADGLAPARAEDAESELAQKDDTFVGQGRAAVIDWSLKDHYTASDVSRYREALLIAEATRDTLSLPLTAGRMIEGFDQKVARDTARRRRKLDNRMESLIMTALETGGISYNDGKIKFTVDFGRPVGQQNQAPAGGAFTATTSDPINAIIVMQNFMFDTYGVRMTRAITSRKVMNTLMNSDKFIARTGLVGNPSTENKIDPRYLLDGWGPTAAQAVVERATGVSFQTYDAVYRTRAIGSNTIVNNRFFSDNKILFLPDLGDLDEVAGDLDIGFAKTLTSPHPMGNWSSGFYEWERETVDPWGRDVGTGIKAFPVFPFMEYSYVMTAI